MERILLAENKGQIRSYLKRTLEEADYHATDVDSATVVAPLLEQGDYDLLLADAAMPETDCIELARHCAEVSPKTNVMFITGFSAVLLKAEAANASKQALSKPFHLNDLIPHIDCTLHDMECCGAC